MEYMKYDEERVLLCKEFATKDTKWEPVIINNNYLESLGLPKHSSIIFSLIRR